MRTLSQSTPLPGRPIARVLVTGAAGFVGRAVAGRLAADGRTVSGTLRQPGELPAGVQPVVIADLTQVADWASVLAGFDGVVHCAARAHVLREAAADPEAEYRRANAELPVAIARGAAAAGVRRMVFLSTIGVLGDRTVARAFRHDDPPDPRSPYAEAKLAAERALAEVAREGGPELAIIRPPLVIGPNPPGNLGMLTAAIERGLPLPFANATGNRRDLVGLDTLADLIAVALDHPAAAGETFLVADGRPLSTRALVETLGALAGKKPRLVPFPTGILAHLLRASGRESTAAQLFGNLEVDIGHACRTLGWAPPVHRVEVS